MDVESGLLTPPPPYNDIVTKPATKPAAKPIRAHLVAIIGRLPLSVALFQLTTELVVGSMWVFLSPMVLFFNPCSMFLALVQGFIRLFLNVLHYFGFLTLPMLVIGLRKRKSCLIFPTIVFQVGVLFLYLFLLDTSVDTIKNVYSPMGEFITAYYLGENAEAGRLLAGDSFVQKVAGLFVALNAATVLFIAAVIYLHVRIYTFFKMVETAKEKEVVDEGIAHFVLVMPLTALIGANKAKKTKLQKKEQKEQKKEEEQEKEVEKKETGEEVMDPK